LHGNGGFRMISSMDYLKLARRVFEIELSEVEAVAARLDDRFVDIIVS
jgi:hypothetical protein